jgi:hypothetical protein
MLRHSTPQPAEQVQTYRIIKARARFGNIGRGREKWRNGRTSLGTKVVSRRFVFFKIKKIPTRSGGNYTEYFKTLFFIALSLVRRIFYRLNDLFKKYVSLSRNAGILSVYLLLLLRLHKHCVLDIYGVCCMDWRACVACCIFLTLCVFSLELSANIGNVVLWSV